MRIFAAALAFAIGLTLWQVPSPQAADLAPRAYDCEPSQPQYYGLYEPWSRREEMPPRKGRWYYTHPQPPAVNFLVPLRGGLCLRPTPWTPAWFEYCKRRWPSFNPDTGTIQTPDGIRMCI